MPHALLHELLAGSGHLPQLLDGAGGDEAAADEPVGVQVGEPRRVVHVGLSPRDVLDVLGIGQRQLERLLEHMPYGPPVDACRFHDHVRDAV